MILKTGGIIMILKTTHVGMFMMDVEKPEVPRNQRTNGPVNAHLRSTTYANKHV